MIQKRYLRFVQKIAYLRILSIDFLALERSEAFDARKGGLKK